MGELLGDLLLRPEATMLRVSVALLVLATIAAILGFTGLAGRHRRGPQNEESEA